MKPGLPGHRLGPGTLRRLASGSLTQILYFQAPVRHGEGKFIIADNTVTTGTGILQLMEQEKLSLEQKVGNIFKEFDTGIYNPCNNRYLNNGISTHLIIQHSLRALFLIQINFLNCYIYFLYQFNYISYNFQYLPCRFCRLS